MDCAAALLATGGGGGALGEVGADDLEGGAALRRDRAAAGGGPRLEGAVDHARNGVVADRDRAAWASRRARAGGRGWGGGGRWQRAHGTARHGMARRSKCACARPARQRCPRSCPHPRKSGRRPAHCALRPVCCPAAAAGPSPVVATVPTKRDPVMLSLPPLTSMTGTARAPVGASTESVKARYASGSLTLYSWAPPTAARWNSKDVAVGMIRVVPPPNGTAGTPGAGLIMTAAPDGIPGIAKTQEMLLAPKAEAATDTTSGTPARALARHQGSVLVLAGPLWGMGERGGGGGRARACGRDSSGPGRPSACYGRPCKPTPASVLASPPQAGLTPATRARAHCWRRARAASAAAGRAAQPALVARSPQPGPHCVVTVQVSCARAPVAAASSSAASSSGSGAQRRGAAADVTLGGRHLQLGSGCVRVRAVLGRAAGAFQACRASARRRRRARSGGRRAPRVARGARHPCARSGRPEPRPEGPSWESRTNRWPAAPSGEPRPGTAKFACTGRDPAEGPPCAPPVRCKIAPLHSGPRWAGTGAWPGLGDLVATGRASARADVAEPWARLGWECPLRVRTS
jgi:hypothetical protein